jgi:hypothetical protein
VTRWQRIALNLVNVVAAGIRRFRGGLNLIDLGDVDNGVRVFTDPKRR